MNPLAAKSGMDRIGCSSGLFLFFTLEREQESAGGKG